MTDKKVQEILAVTKKFLDYVESEKFVIQEDKYLFSSFLEVCKVLESSITVIEVKIERREKRKSKF